MGHDFINSLIMGVLLLNFNTLRSLMIAFLFLGACSSEPQNQQKTKHDVVDNKELLNDTLIRSTHISHLPTIVSVQNRFAGEIFSEKVEGIESMEIYVMPDHIYTAAPLRYEYLENSQDKSIKYRQVTKKSEIKKYLTALEEVSIDKFGSGDENFGARVLLKFNLKQNKNSKFRNHNAIKYYFDTENFYYMEILSQRNLRGDSQRILIAYPNKNSVMSLKNLITDIG